MKNKFCVANKYEMKDALDYSDGNENKTKKKNLNKMINNFNCLLVKNYFRHNSF